MGNDIDRKNHILYCEKCTRALPLRVLIDFPHFLVWIQIRMIKVNPSIVIPSFVADFSPFFPLPLSSPWKPTALGIALIRKFLVNRLRK